jgi:hypothetical protein
MRCHRVCSGLRDTSNSRQVGRPLALSDSTQQQHQRGRSLPCLFEDRARQQCVIDLASPTAVGGKMSLRTESSPLDAAAAGTCEPLRIQVTL